MKPPIYTLRPWLRIILRAIGLFVVADLLFIAIQPFDEIERLSWYGSMFPYRTRLVMPDTDLAVQLMPLETLLNAHEIAQPKQDDEFRVVVLGDSGINGVGNLDSETIPAYLTAAGVEIQNRRIRAYNLASPQANVTRDLVIADGALDFQPDLIIWFVTVVSFRNALDRLIEVNQPRMTRLASKFQLEDINSTSYGRYVEDAWWQRSIFFKRTRILRWLKFQAYSFRVMSPEKFEPSNYEHKLAEASVYGTAQTDLPSQPWMALTALSKLTTVPVLIVNEPILIVPKTTPGSDVAYNEVFGRERYDHYRTMFNQFCRDHNFWCMDIWDLVASTEFTDSPFHHTAAGNATIAARVLEEVKRRLNAPPTPNS